MSTPRHQTVNNLFQQQGNLVIVARKWSATNNNQLFLILLETFAARSVLRTNCFPALSPANFFLFVAALCAGVNRFHAFAGRYLRIFPSRRAGFPSDVVQRSFVHFFNDLCVRDGLPLYPPPAFRYAKAKSCALRADHCPGLPPLLPAIIWRFRRSRTSGLV